MDESTAFATFCQLMHGRHYQMRQMYQRGFPLLQKMFVIFRHLIRQYLPYLAFRFEELSIDVAFFASHWFLTLFAYQFPAPLVAAVWDKFFAEGWKVIFRVALALLKWDEQKLLPMRMEDMLLHLKNIHEGKSIEEIMVRAMAIPVKERDLRVPTAEATE